MIDFIIAKPNNDINCHISKVVIKWDKNISFEKKEKIFLEAFEKNYNNYIAKNGSIYNLSTSNKMVTRNHLSCIYFFYPSATSNEKMIKNTKKIFDTLFKPIKNSPSYIVIEDKLSDKEMKWVVETSIIYGVEIRSYITDENGTVKYNELKTPRVEEWLKRETEKQIKRSVHYLPSGLATKGVSRNAV